MQRRNEIGSARRMKNEIELGSIALVTKKSGYQYVGIWSLAPGIDYYWSPVVPATRGLHHITDPDVSFDVIGIECVDD